jgi:hypothetical protein
MKLTGDTNEIQKTRRSWIWYVLIILIVEKIIQHLFVTIAFYSDIGDIRSTVAVDADLLMITGAMVAILFMLSLWGVFARKNWAINLVIALALFDIIGEFIAQGKIDIMITVSFIVAIILLVLAFVYPRQGQRQAK